jgi:hypothetical protein
MEEYSTTCSLMKYIQGWQFVWQLKMDELFHEHWQHTFFFKKLNKKNNVNFFMLVYFEKFNTWNSQIIFHIFLIWNILSSATSKPYTMLNKSNSMAYKPIDPPRGTCPLGIETIWSSPWYFTLSIPFKINFYFHSFFQPFAFKTVRATYIIKLHFFPCIINFHDLYFNLHYHHLYYLLASFLPLFYNGKKKIDTNCHTTPWNLWLNIN